MTTLTVLDNGDGTLSLSGSAVTDAGGGLLALAAGPAVHDNGDGTLSLTGVSSGQVLAVAGPARVASRAGPWAVRSRSAGPAALRTARSGPAELATVIGPAVLSSL